MFVYYFPDFAFPGPRGPVWRIRPGETAVPRPDHPIDLERVQTMRRVLPVLVLALAGTGWLVAAPQKPAASPTADAHRRQHHARAQAVGTPPSAVRWSKDSSKIYFSWQKATDERSATFVVNRDGTGLKQLTPEEVRAIETPPDGPVRSRPPPRCSPPRTATSSSSTSPRGARRVGDAHVGAESESALDPQRHGRHVQARRQSVSDVARSGDAHVRAAHRHRHGGPAATRRPRRPRAVARRRRRPAVAAAAVAAAVAVPRRGWRRRRRAAGQTEAQRWLARAGARSDSSSSASRPSRARRRRGWRRRPWRRRPRRRRRRGAAHRGAADPALHAQRAADARRPAALRRRALRLRRRHRAARGHRARPGRRRTTSPSRPIPR